MQENETLEFYKNYVSEEGLIINLEDLLNCKKSVDIAPSLCYIVGEI